MKVVSLHSLLQGDARENLIKSGFPIEEIVKIPVTAIEGMATHNDGRFGGVCGRACIGCSANALHPLDAKGPVVVMAPELLSSILRLALSLAGTGNPILSSIRLNLFSGSNELDHPHCIALRNQMSDYCRTLYGSSYGALSSDLIFHVSPSNVFRNNLKNMLGQARLFDNICFAIDEQIPHANSRKYNEYLKALAWVWEVLDPALKGHLDHADENRIGGPRVILNLLLPSSDSGYTAPFKFLHPGGPERATTYEELAERYVEPFVGQITEIDDPIPSHHVFTNSIGTLDKVKDSKVFVSKAVFEPVGRARSILKGDGVFSCESFYAPCIRTKIYPVDKNRFVFQAALAPNRFSDGELEWTDKPEWVKNLSNFVFDASTVFN